MMANKKTLKNKLWKLVSEYVRRKDADPHTGVVACYTCGSMRHWTEGDAGHGIPGRKNMVLFDLEVLRFQCKSCNRNQGEQYIFGKRLNEENGEGWFERKLIESKQPKKYYIKDYEEMINDFLEKLNVLDNQL